MQRRALLKSSVLAAGLLALPGVSFALEQFKRRDIKRELLDYFKQEYVRFSFYNMDEVSEFTNKFCTEKLWPLYDRKEIKGFKITGQSNEAGYAQFVFMLSLNNDDRIFAATVTYNPAKNISGVKTFRHEFDNNGYIKIDDLEVNTDSKVVYYYRRSFNRKTQKLDESVVSDFCRLHRTIE